MKFIHTADLHLDSKIERIPLEKSKILREEVLASFERLCDYAINNGILAVIISGDMFDTNKVSSKTMLRVLNAINKAKNVDFLYLSGNHDEESLFFNLESRPENLKFFSDVWTSFVYDNVRILGINFSNKNTSTYAETLTLNPDEINIVALHGQIAGYNSSDNSEIISLPKLKNKNIDYLALGHIHSYSEGELDLRGKYVYSGALSSRGFDELGEKGFSLIEIDNNKLNNSFISFCNRNFIVKNYELDMSKTWYENADSIYSDLSEKISKKSLVKVIIEGDITPDYLIDIDSFEKKLNDYFFFAKIYDKTSLNVTIEDYKNDKSIIGEFVRTVLSEQMDKGESDKILLCGLNALNKKEIY